MTNFLFHIIFFILLILTERSVFANEYFLKKNITDKTRIQLKLIDKVFVKNNVIYLSDISECSGNDILCHDTRGIEITRFSDQSKEILVSKNAIKNILSIEWPFTEVIFSGSPMSKVKKSEVENQELNSFASEIKSSFERKFKILSKYPVEIDIDQLDVPEFKAKGRIEILGITDIEANDPHWIFNNFSKIKKLTIGIYDIDNENPLEVFDINLAIFLKPKTLVASNDILKGQVITREDLSFENKNRTIRHPQNAAQLSTKSYFESDGRLKTSEEIISFFVGRVAESKIEKGDQVATGNTIKQVVIKKNQPITVIVTKRGLAVNFRGKSNQEGSIGDMIEVIYPNSRRILKARVVDSQTARLSLDNDQSNDQNSI